MDFVGLRDIALKLVTNEAECRGILTQEDAFGLFRLGARRFSMAGSAINYALRAKQAQFVVVEPAVVISVEKPDAIKTTIRRAKRPGVG